VPWQLASSAGRDEEDRMVRGFRSRELPDFERAPEE
jgi:hypothetical protein